MMPWVDWGDAYGRHFFEDAAQHGQVVRLRHCAAGLW